ncbi:Protein-methionine-sulfoxide reductase catalytic subunit MsrP [Methylobacterium cerastii]|uniref:Protein-methionine-sulfoxide reductase catalytic subunit MsrP n=1 Tax=Methylobacterium cerastii TaxID=932741 RepID=A0ABQ4QNL3_9HYPH|nr:MULTISPECIES: molybdopterin-binding protein [Methylobacterium]TXN09804.1 molybdopterin-dependent oxidoreductase [Methylobacterium sp. WL122]TXN80856.1 molybdopterin-dependent oxidoreductase [Methylobacterium sp. WL8]GJD46843.1 Protein-methionine-sulfoxide reductase catalytic subunit MsrP [Methylobacterium cerastii]
MSTLDRRRFLTTVAALGGTAMLAGCDRFAGSAYGPRTLKAGEDANLFVQRLLLSNASLAREFPESEISAVFKPNGTIDPPDKAYKALAASNFSTFKLEVGGLVERPQSFSLADLRGLPSRTQTTRHDCVEGWSCIGKWAGVPLSEVLNRAGLKPQARYVVFHCADTLEYAGGGLEGGKDGTKDGAFIQPENPSAVRHVQVAAAGNDADAWGGTPPEEPEETRTPIRYYESIDLTDAFHPQTILAYDLNGKPLPVSNGAPLRLRIERQLGYKQAKYVMRIEVVDSLAKIGDGQGGYWEDRGYEWYAGI